LEFGVDETVRGDLEQARRLDTGLALARDTGMCFYDAELLRLRAHTHTDPDARQAALGAALELARSQGVTLFELRWPSTTMTLMVSPPAPPSSRPPAASPQPARGRKWRGLKLYAAGSTKRRPA
jgi:hypothetical protein